MKDAQTVARPEVIFSWSLELFTGRLWKHKVGFGRREVASSRQSLSVPSLWNLRRPTEHEIMIVLYILESKIVTLVRRMCMQRLTSSAVCVQPHDEVADCETRVP